MVDVSAIGQVFNPTTGVFTLVALAIIAWFKTRPLIMERLNERNRDQASITSDDWQRLRDEIAWLTTEVKECRENEGKWIERAILAEAKLQGEAQVRQAKAEAQAEVRADPAKSPESIKAAERVRKILDGEEGGK